MTFNRSSDQGVRISFGTLCQSPWRLPLQECCYDSVKNCILALLDTFYHQLVRLCELAGQQNPIGTPRRQVGADERRKNKFRETLADWAGPVRCRDEIGMESQVSDLFLTLDPEAWKSIKDMNLQLLFQDHTET